MSWKAKRYQRKKNKVIKHHMKNRCNGGTDIPQNLLRMYEDREKEWHNIFKNLSWLEALELMVRVAKAKRHEQIEPGIKRFYGSL